MEFLFQIHVNTIELCVENYNFKLSMVLEKDGLIVFFFFLFNIKSENDCQAKLTCDLQTLLLYLVITYCF